MANEEKPKVEAGQASRMEVNEKPKASAKANGANEKLAPVLCIDSDDQLDLEDGDQFRQGSKKPYASISVLDPVITVEFHSGKYHIAARFNIETTILDYHSRRR